MADDRVVGEIVSEFFFNSCRQRRPLNMDAIAALLDSSRIVVYRATNDDEVDVIPLTTGSVVEFYIEPMLSCVGDVDIMGHWSSRLAIPQGHPPPTQLPDEFHGRVLVAEIIDSEFPGYVYLVTSYVLTEITDGKYNTVQCPRQYWAHNLTREHGDNVQGPAFVTKLSLRKESIFCSGGAMSSSDMVLCHGLYMPLIGQHDSGTMAGQTQQLLIMLSVMDVMWWAWHIVCVDKMNG